MNAIPWYKSQVFVGAVVAIISQVLVLLGKQDLFPLEVITKNVEAVFQIVALVATAYAAWKRKASDVQPLTATKAGATKANQGGFLRLHLALAIVFGVIGSGLIVQGCTHTTAAYREADTPSDYALVVLEQYDALLIEANRLKASGSATPGQVDQMRAADIAVQPFINAIRPLQRAYEASQSSGDAAALQLAVNEAIGALADLVRAVKNARGGE